jgi:hypothetical protein
MFPIKLGAVILPPAEIDPLTAPLPVMDNKFVLELKLKLPVPLNTPLALS